MNLDFRSFLSKTSSFVKHISRRNFTTRRRNVYESLANGGVIQYHPVSNNHQGVLIVLSGWLGGRPQYMKKYVDFWKSKNFDVLCYQTRWIDLLFPRRTFDRKGLHLAQAIHKSKDLYPKVMFHTFSSGAYLYAATIEAIIQHAQYHHCTENIKGVVFDSLADWPHTLTTRKSLTDFLGPRTRILPVERVRSDAMPALRSSAKSFPPYLQRPPFSFDNFQDKNRTIYANPFNIPGLFLYSEADLLSHTFQIGRIIDHWTQRKILVASKHWPESEHVQHYRLHKTEYERQVELFIARALEMNCDFK